MPSAKAPASPAETRAVYTSFAPGRTRRLRSRVPSKEAALAGLASGHRLLDRRVVPGAQRLPTLTRLQNFFHSSNVAEITGKRRRLLALSQSFGCIEEDAPHTDDWHIRGAEALVAPVEDGAHRFGDHQVLAHEIVDAAVTDFSLLLAIDQVVVFGCQGASDGAAAKRSLPYVVVCGWRQIGLRLWDRTRIARNVVRETERLGEPLQQGIVGIGAFLSSALYVSAIVDFGARRWRRRQGPTAIPDQDVRTPGRRTRTTDDDRVVVARLHRRLHVDDADLVRP